MLLGSTARSGSSYDQQTGTNVSGLAVWQSCWVLNVVRLWPLSATGIGVSGWPYDNFNWILNRIWHWYAHQLVPPARTTRSASNSHLTNSHQARDCHQIQVLYTTTLPSRLQLALLFSWATATAIKVDLAHKRWLTCDVRGWVGIAHTFLSRLVTLSVRVNISIVCMAIFGVDKGRIAGTMSALYESCIIALQY